MNDLAATPDTHFFHFGRSTAPQPCGAGSLASLALGELLRSRPADEFYAAAQNHPVVVQSRSSTAMLQTLTRPQQARACIVNHHARAALVGPKPPVPNGQVVYEPQSFAQAAGEGAANADWLAELRAHVHAERADMRSDAHEGAQEALDTVRQLKTLTKAWKPWRDLTTLPHTLSNNRAIAAFLAHDSRQRDAAMDTLDLTTPSLTLAPSRAAARVLRRFIPLASDAPSAEHLEQAVSYITQLGCQSLEHYSHAIAARPNPFTVDRDTLRAVKELGQSLDVAFPPHAETETDLHHAAIISLARCWDRSVAPHQQVNDLFNRLQERRIHQLTGAVNAASALSTATSVCVKFLVGIGRIAEAQAQAQAPQSLRAAHQTAEATAVLIANEEYHAQMQYQSIHSAMLNENSYWTDIIFPLHI